MASLGEDRFLLAGGFDTDFEHMNTTYILDLAISSAWYRVDLDSDVYRQWPGRDYTVLTSTQSIPSRSPFPEGPADRRRLSTVRGCRDFSLGHAQLPMFRR